MQINLILQWRGVLQGRLFPTLVNLNLDKVCAAVKEPIARTQKVYLGFLTTWNNKAKIDVSSEGPSTGS